MLREVLSIAQAQVHSLHYSYEDSSHFETEQKVQTGDKTRGLNPGLATKKHCNRTVFLVSSCTEGMHGILKPRMMLATYSRNVLNVGGV